MKYSVNCHTTQEAGNRLLLTLTYRLLRLRLSEYKSLSVIYIYIYVHIYRSGQTLISFRE